MEAIDILVFVGNVIRNPKSDLVDISRSIEFVTNLEHDLNANALKAVEYISTCSGMADACLGPTLVEISVNRMKDITSISPRMTASEYQAYCNVVDWHRLSSVVRDLKDMCSERLVRFMNDAKDDASINAAQFGLMYGTTDELQVSQLVSMIGVTQASYEIQDDSSSESDHKGALDHVCEHK